MTLATLLLSLLSLGCGDKDADTDGGSADGGAADGGGADGGTGDGGTGDGGTDGGTGDGGTDGGTGDGGTDGGTSDGGAESDCGPLADPVAIPSGTADSVIAQVGAYFAHSLPACMDILLGALEDPRCPMQSFDSTTTTFTWDAGTGCTDRAGVAWSGRLVQAYDMAKKTTTIAFEGLQGAGTVGGDTFDILLDGEVGFVGDPSAGFSYGLDLHTDATLSGPSARDYTGCVDAAYDSLGWVVQDGASGRIEMQVRTRLSRAPVGLETGEYCVTLAEEPVETCEDEPDSVSSFQGANRVDYVADGSVDCDGCGRVWLDGVDLGEYCE